VIEIRHWFRGFAKWNFRRLRQFYQVIFVNKGLRVLLELSLVEIKGGSWYLILFMSRGYQVLGVSHPWTRGADCGLRQFVQYALYLARVQNQGDGVYAHSDLWCHSKRSYSNALRSALKHVFLVSISAYSLSKAVSWFHRLFLRALVTCSASNSSSLSFSPFFARVSISTFIYRLGCYHAKRQEVNCGWWTRINLSYPTARKCYVLGEFDRPPVEH